jgi:hypothetical protein
MRQRFVPNGVVALVGVLTASLLLLSTNASAGPSTSVRYGHDSNQAVSDSVSLSGSEIQTLGQDDFASTFTGVNVLPSGEIDVYAIPTGDESFVAAVQALDLVGANVVFVPSTRSIYNLLSLESTIGSDRSLLIGVGVTPVGAYPNPTSSTVEVTLATPTATDMAELGSCIQLHPTLDQSLSQVQSQNYVAAATAVVDYMVGNGVVVLPAFSAAMSPVGRVGDTAPFSGGDAIYGGYYYAQCSSGFAVKSSTGSPEMLTAGHCSIGTWYTTSLGSPTLGTVNHQYFNNANGDDFETIAVSSVLGRVWANAGSTHPVNGRVIPAVGGTMAFDGSVTGEVTGNIVSEVNADEYGIYDPFTGGSYDAYNLVIAYSPTNSQICIGGDSGGPAYQRESGTSSVHAIGTIVAEYGTDTCAVEEIGAELSHGSLTLVTS